MMDVNIQRQGHVKKIEKCDADWGVGRSGWRSIQNQMIQSQGAGESGGLQVGEGQGQV
jgi:hypothetical protein